jgi:carotenoid 1,2-hydratase
MTERAQRHVRREPRLFAVGPSRLLWTGRSLDLAIDERGAPLPRTVLGHLSVVPDGLPARAFALDDAGRHRWQPIAPCARIHVDLHKPSLRWSGTAYFDSNEGDEPIEHGFTRWDWLRTASPDGGTTVVYDVEPRHGAARVLAQRFMPGGQVQALTVPARQPLPRTTWWRVDRQVCAADSSSGFSVDPPRVLRTLEDTPFYARSLLDLSLDGERREHAVHETLDVRRLTQPWVQTLLPFRMPRRS